MNITERQFERIVKRAVEEALERAKALEKPRARPKPREVYEDNTRYGGGCHVFRGCGN